MLEAQVEEAFGDDRLEWDTPAALAQHLDAGFCLRPHLAHLSERLAQAVRDVEGGRSRFLLISMPPRMGKSHLGSINFPVWVLHRHPAWKLMLLSHSPDLAAGW